MISRRAAMAGLVAGSVVPLQGLRAEGRVFKAGIGIENNRVEIAVGMNGRGPYIFMIDTGTYISLIRPDLARQLALPVRGVERTSGVGGKAASFTTYLARDFVIGGTIRQAAVVLEDSFQFGYRQDIYGALAAGILTATDTDLDLDAGELRIYPDGRGERPGYAAVDSYIPRLEQPQRGSRKITATLMLDDRPIRCMLDTGAPSYLTLNHGAARRLGLWDGRPYAPARPRGIAGEGPVARVIRARSLAMGDTRHERPLVTLLGNDIGNGGDSDGIVGLSFLRRFNLSIDTRGRRLWVQPSRQPPVPDHYGMSGLWLDRNGDRILVADVGTGSPAAGAGVTARDRIVGLAWEEALARINGRPGTAVTLPVERNGVRRDVTLTPAPYL